MVPHCPARPGAAPIPCKVVRFSSRHCTLKPRVVRLDAAALTELVDSARPAF
jgi:hypothetical protein